MVGGGLAFAIPSRIVGQFIAITGAPGTMRPKLGVEVLVVPLPAALAASVSVRTESAVMVAAVEPDGPAARAGVQIGDLLIGLDGRVIATPRDLLVALSRSVATPGARGLLTLVRAGQRKELALTYERQPSAEAA
jgi:serine protease Do